jgi:homoserine dehydrogenase
MSSKRIGIGLLGFGTVGAGLFTLLRDNRAEIAQKYGVEFDVVKVLVRDPQKKRSVSLPSTCLASSFDEILADDSIDVVVEVMGGMEPAESHIIAALKRGKDVVTANKALR